jgi:hypothetical protein
MLNRRKESDTYLPTVYTSLEKRDNDEGRQIIGVFSQNCGFHQLKRLLQLMKAKVLSESSDNLSTFTIIGFSSNVYRQLAGRYRSLSFSFNIFLI